MLSDIITINGLIGADVNGRHICVKDTADNRSALFSIMADEKLANLIAEIVTNANGDADSNNPEEPPTPPSETVEAYGLRDRLNKLFKSGTEKVELVFDYTDAAGVSKLQYITVDGKDFLNRQDRRVGEYHAPHMIPDTNIHGRNDEGEWRSFRLDRIDGNIQINIG